MPKTQEATRLHSLRFQAYGALIQQAYPELPDSWGGPVQGEDGQDDDILTSHRSDVLIRFPRRADAVKAMEREAAVLHTLQGFLPLPIPNPVYVSHGVHEVGRAFMGFAKFPGKPLYQEMLESIDDEGVIQEIVEQLALFLSSLHRIPVTQLEQLALPTAPSREALAALYTKTYEELFPQMSQDRQPCSSLGRQQMRFRFATWNVNAFRRLSGHAALIRSVECDLLALQELTQTSYDNLAASGLFDWSAFSLTLRPPQPGEGRARSLGCALFGRTPFTLSSFRLLESVRLPERTLIATLETPSGPLTACSFHAPPGATWKAVKPQTFVYIANWLVDHPQRVIFGMDANTPAADHPDSNKIRWHWVDEPVLLGHNAEHTLRDVFRTYLAAHPEELEEIRRVRPEGPLAISYDRGRLSGKFIPCRYDCICASPDLQVERMEYLYDEGLQAGSDHALVIATMRCEG